MNIRTIAIKNISRKKSRSILIVVSLIVAILAYASVMLLSSAFKDRFDEQLSEYGFNVMVFPRASNLSLSYGGMTVSGVSAYKTRTLATNDVNKIKNLNNEKIRSISPKLIQPINMKGKHVLLLGVDFKDEKTVKKWWELQAGRYPSKDNEVLIGITAANNLGLKVGDEVQVAESGKYGPLKIAGILNKSGSQDDEIIFGSLTMVSTYFNRDSEINLIEIAVKSTRDIDEVVGSISGALPDASVTSVKQAIKYKEEAMGYLSKFGLIITIVVLSISAMIVFITMTTSVAERTKEIGILRAMGYRKSKIMQIVLLEAVTLSFVGGLVGYFAGFGISKAIPRIIEGMDISPSFDLSVFVSSLVIALFVGAASSFLPALKASMLDPAESLRSL